MSVGLAAATKNKSDKMSNGSAQGKDHRPDVLKSKWVRSSQTLNILFGANLDQYFASPSYTTNPMFYVTLIMNLLSALFEARKFQAVKMFLPLIYITIWNTVVEYIDLMAGTSDKGLDLGNADNYDAAKREKDGFTGGVLTDDTPGAYSIKISTVIARLLFAVKFVYTLYILQFIVKKNLQEEIDAGNLEEEITVDKTEMNNEGKMVTSSEVMTVGEYDMAEWWKFGQQQAMQLLPIFGIHYYYKYTVPLVISSIMGMQHLYDCPLYLLYVTGKDASGEGLSEEQKKMAKRPFKNSNDPMEMMKNMQSRMGMDAEGEDSAAKKPAAGAAGVMGPKEGKVSSKSLKMAEKKAALAEGRKMK